MAEYLIQEETLVDIANSIRSKIGTAEQLAVSDFALSIEAIEAGGGKTTKTINIDWSGDEEYTCMISYISNKEIVSITRGYDIYDVYESIEAEGGIIIYNYDSLESTSNFIYLGSLDGYGPNPSGIIYIATQDGETIYPISTGEQDN